MWHRKNVAHFLAQRDYENLVVAPHNSLCNNLCLYSGGPPVPDGH